MRSLSYLSLAALMGASTSFAQNSTQDTTIQCAPGLKMFVSRGTGEEMGLGETEILVEAIAKQINGSDYEPVLYPASNGDNGEPSYFASVANGTALVKKHVKDYAKACPNSKVALFGWSQGGQITTNSLCGTPPIWTLWLGYEAGVDIQKIVDDSAPLSEEVTKNIVSVVLLGDTTHNNQSSYNYGNATGSGIFYRPGSESCEKLGQRIRSYCDAGDPFCDVEGFPSATAHVAYLKAHFEDIVKYVVTQYQNGGESGESGSGSGNSPSPSTSSVPVNAGGQLSPVPILAIMASLLVVGMI